MSLATDTAKALRDGFVTPRHRARAANAVVEWLEESLVLGGEVVNAARHLAVMDDEPASVDHSPADNGIEPPDAVGLDEDRITVPAAPIEEPKIEDVGPLIGRVWPGSLEIFDLDTSSGSTVYPCHKSYAAAAVKALAGSQGIVEVRGDCSAGVNNIGGGSTPWAGDAGWWDGQPVKVAFRGMDDSATLGEITMRQSMNNGDVHGVAHLWLENLAVRAHHGRCIGGMKGDELGLLTMRNILLRANPEAEEAGEYYGFGFKWGMRISARCRYDIVGLVCDPVQEHPIYLDSPSGDSRFWNISSGGSWRTVIQIVSRSVDNPGPPSRGTLWFKDIGAHYPFEAPDGEGGSAITVAGGHDGPILVEGLTLIEAHEGKGHHGAVAIWVDAKHNHGAYLWTRGDGGLYAYPEVTLRDIKVDSPRAQRTPVSVRGASKLVLGSYASNAPREFLIETSRYAVAGTTARVDDGPVRDIPNLHDTLWNGDTVHSESLTESNP